MRLEAGVDETVSALYLDGEEAYQGTWGGAGSGAEILNSTYFTGSGVLTVLNGPIRPPQGLVIK